MPPVKKSKAALQSTEEEVIPVVSGQLRKKIVKQNKRKTALKRGVVFIKHLPRGFFEDQLRGYFEQFGTVTRLRLARSKITGGSKGYAFVEFEYPEVAEVAAETMDNYLMFNKVLKAVYIPPEKQTKNLFKTSVRLVKNKVGKPIYVSRKTAAVNSHVKRFNDISEEAYQIRTSSQVGKIQKLNKKFAHLGIDFSTILIGSSVVEMKDDIKKPGKYEMPTKDEKRKATNTDKPNKKAKITSNTKREDPSFEDSEGNRDSNENVIKCVDLEGDSGDDDSLANSNGENSQSGDTTEEQLAEIEDAGDCCKEEIKPPKKLQTQKKMLPGKKPKQNRLEQVIKVKKGTGGIQKPTKSLSKKRNLNLKNQMQLEMVKRLAKPLSSIKKQAKASK